jgi:hypothetical protein
LLRKSPYRHRVRTYRRRSGKVVHQYERGKGDKPTKLAKPTLGHHKSSSTRAKYIAQITYISQPAETFPVVASSYPEAIDTALSIRRQITPPYQIDIKRLRT